ncbi:hypothetical protein JX266_007238 [Neoarthrinium moseri]|nr:hypothetical protein JX266_007238 [Neoarthrinium moseri]
MHEDLGAARVLAQESHFEFDFDRHNTYSLDYTYLDAKHTARPDVQQQLDLKGWLHREQKLAEHATLDESSHIKLAVLCQIGRGRRLPISGLLTAIGVPSYARIEGHDFSFHSFPPRAEDDSVLLCEATVYTVSRWDFGVAWTYYHQSHRSVGVVWAKSTIGQTEAASLLKQIHRSGDVLPHPLMLHAVALQAMAVSVNSWIQGLKQDVIQAQYKSGYHYFHPTPMPASGNGVDFGSLSSSLSGQAANLVTAGLQLQGLQGLAAFIQKEKFVSNTAADSEGRTRDAMLRAESHIRLEAKYWEKECEFLERAALSWERKASIVVAGLFNLISQRDQSTSIEIAKSSQDIATESKRDSTSMKAIAAVTMCFLPGTFVAVSKASPVPN